MFNSVSKFEHFMLIHLTLCTRNLKVKNFAKTDSYITLRVNGFHYEYHNLILYSDIIAYFS